jgi:hypothetical protein
MKPGFYPRKDAKTTTVEYAKYFLVPGIWVNHDEEVKPTECWAAYTPDKKYMGCNSRFLCAKEKIKIAKIQKFIKK